MGFIIVLVIIVAVGFLLVGIFNSITSLENRVANALAQIDVQLKKRGDLVPNLVNTVKGYAAHESGVFEAVTKARSMLQTANTVEEKAAASNALTGALRTVFAVAENYPQLKADTSFLNLQSELSDLEGKVAYSRQFYNDTVLMYNNSITTIPGVFLAGPMSKIKKSMFEASEGDRAVPEVKF
jgi:LemA protein